MDLSPEERFKYIGVGDVPITPEVRALFARVTALRGFQTPAITNALRFKRTTRNQISLARRDVTTFTRSRTRARITPNRWQKGPSPEVRPEEVIELFPQRPEMYISSRW